MKQFSFLMLAIFLIAACSTPAVEDKSVFAGAGLRKPHRTVRMFKG